MTICNNLRDGSLSSISVEYLCKICHTASVVRLEGKMESEEMSANKKLVGSILCRKHYAEALNVATQS